MISVQDVFEVSCSLKSTGFALPRPIAELEQQGPAYYKTRCPAGYRSSFARIARR